MELLNINISSNSFATNAGNSFKELFDDLELTDVTLVCSDDQQIKAHKVILGSSSPVESDSFKPPLISSKVWTPTPFLHYLVNKTTMTQQANPFLYCKL